MCWHKFSPRYDIGRSNANLSGFEGPAVALMALAEAARPKTYVRDVCERCGKTIERAPSCASRAD